MTYRGLTIVIVSDNGNVFANVYDRNGGLFESMSVPNGVDPNEFAKKEIDEFFAGAHAI